MGEEERQWYWWTKFRACNKRVLSLSLFLQIVLSSTLLSSIIVDTEVGLPVLSLWDLISRRPTECIFYIVLVKFICFYRLYPWIQSDDLLSKLRLFGCVLWFYPSIDGDHNDDMSDSWRDMLILFILNLRTLLICSGVLFQRRRPIRGVKATRFISKWPHSMGTDRSFDSLASRHICWAIAMSTTIGLDWYNDTGSCSLGELPGT